MAFSDNLRKQHAELVAMMRQVEPQLDAQTLPANAAKMRGQLSSLAKKLVNHLVLEDDILYPLMAQHEDAKVRDLGNQFITEMSNIKPAFEAFYTQWTESEIRTNPGTFCDEAKKLFAAVDNRIIRENRQLYPVADVAALSSPLCATR